ncbi:MAG TPA: hypothetical protein VME44_28350 [Streptosporangiaceae bacterium]|nr:hypothetical protein [Streptosporangiaceae bacterium]
MRYKPPTGKTFAILQVAGSSQAEEETQAFAAPLAALGWKEKVIDYDETNPATLISAMKAALLYHPVAVTFAAIPYAEWAVEVPAYDKAGVALIPVAAGPLPANKEIAGNITGPIYLQLAAHVIADWFIVASNGSGHGLLYNVPDAPAVAEWGQDFRKYVAAGCSRCSLTVVSQSIADVMAGGENADIVSALQRNPSDKYVFMADYPLTVGLPSALHAAGISGIQIGGSYAGAADQALIKEGQEAAGTPQALDTADWSAIDAVVRHLEGMPQAPGDDIQPIQLLTSATVGTPVNSFNYPAGYQEYFKKLWRVG